MPTTRRDFVRHLGSLGAALLAASGAKAQNGATPAPAQAPSQPRFGYDDVVRRAKDLAGAPYDASLPALPDPLAKLDFDSYRDIRFRPDKALLGGNGGPFRMQMFHPGFL